MTTSNAHALASFGTPAGNLVNTGGLLRDLGALFTKHRHQLSERARIRRELQGYSDRELQDLGLSRFDIEAVAQGRHRR